MSLTPLPISNAHPVLLVRVCICVRACVCVTSLGNIVSVAWVKGLR